MVPIKYQHPTGQSVVSDQPAWAKANAIDRPVPRVAPRGTTATRFFTSMPWFLATAVTSSAPPARDPPVVDEHLSGLPASTTACRLPAWSAKTARV